MHIRNIRTDEAARLSEFLRKIFLATYAHCSTEQNVAHFLEHQYGVDLQAAELADPTMRSFVLAENETWIGVAQLRISNSATPGHYGAAGYVSRFFLEAPYHGQGLAQKLLEHLIDSARGVGLERLHLSAWKKAPQAIRFYEKAGFQRIATADFVIGSEVLEDWLMQLTL